MKKINKYLVGILFTLGLLFTGATLASADTITGDVTITIVPVVPTVTISAVTSITQTSAVSGGNIVDNGGAPIDLKGVVWSSNGTTPTIYTSNNGMTSNGTGDTSFVSTLAPLGPNTAYKVRAYARNSAGVGYSDPVSIFITLAGTCPAPLTQNVTVACDPINGVAAISGSVTRSQNKSLFLDSPSCTFPTPVTTSNSTYVSDTCNYLPIVTSPTATNITTTSVTIGANVTFMGIPSATAASMCIDKSSGTTGCSTSGISSTGPITRNVTGLTPNTMYYYKGNAINSAGTGWSTTGSFKTLPLAPNGSISVPTSSCIIPTGSGSCPLSLYWGVANIDYANTSTAITAIGYYQGLTIDSPVKSGTLSVPVTRLSKLFYLFNNSNPLATATLYADCDPTTDIWDSTTNTCIKKTYTVTSSSITVNGSVGDGGSITPTTQSVKHGSTTTFTVTKNIGYSLSMGGTCGVGSLSGNTYNTPIIRSNCTVVATFTKVTGTLTAVPASCSIPNGQSSCNLNLDWSVTNPIGVPTAITANGSPYYTEVSGLSGTQSVPVPYLDSPRTFYLYNSGVELDNLQLTSNCANVWDPINKICTDITYPVTTSVKTDKGVANVGGTISPTSQNVNKNSKATFTVTPDVSNGYFINSVTDTCGASGSLSGNTYTTGSITVACNVAVMFKMHSYSISASKTGTGNGTIASDDNLINCGTTCSSYYNYGTVVNLTATPDANSRFTGWTQCPAQNSGGQCVVTVDSSKTVTANFASVSMSVVASPTIYNVPESNTSVSFAYTPTISSGSMSCRLVDNNKADLAGSTWKASSPIVFSTPSTGGIGYGYYIKCISNDNSNILPVFSNLITVNVVKVSVNAATPYNVAPGATVPFAYVASTAPIGSTECLLQDYSYADVTKTYQPLSPISAPVINDIGSYGYYVKCRNTTVNAAIVTSNKIIVNTSCVGGVWDGTAKKCIAPTVDHFTASDCTIPATKSSCPSSLSWEVLNPMGPTAVTTPTNITVKSGNPGAATYNLTYGSTPFYLYHNVITGNEPPLKTITATAKCADGTGWTNGACMPPSGSLTATGCTISENQSSCPSTLTWNTINPLSGIYSIIKTPTSTGTTIATGNSNSSLISGSNIRNIIYGTTNFYLMHNGIILDTKSATAGCGFDHSPTSGGTCAINPPDSTNTTFTATPATIFKGKISTLEWKSRVATSCTIKNTTTTPATVVVTGGPNGTKQVSPEVTTSYSLSCINATSSFNINQPVKVVDVTIKEN